VGLTAVCLQCVPGSDSDVKTKLCILDANVVLPAPGRPHKTTIAILLFISYFILNDTAYEEIKVSPLLIADFGVHFANPHMSQRALTS
jgi:hypothetical protein